MQIRFIMKVFKKELKALKKQQSTHAPTVQEETFSFTDAMAGVKPLAQDKVEPNKQVELLRRNSSRRLKILNTVNNLLRRLTFQTCTKPYCHKKARYVIAAAMCPLMC